MNTLAMRAACLAHAARLETRLAQARGEVPTTACAAPTHLHVRIDGVVRALPIACVREVLPALPVVRLRGAPPGIRGLVQARGRAVPVHSTSADAPAHPVLVLIEHAGDCHALEVEAVLDLGEAPDAGEVLDVAAWVAGG